MDCNLLFVPTIIFIWLIVAYSNKKSEYDILQNKYNQTNCLLNAKIEEIENIKKEYNTLNENYCKLREEYKEELNKRKYSDQRLKKAKEIFIQQKQQISDLEQKNKNLDIENEELFTKTLLLKQDSDFNKVYDAIKQGKNVFITGGAGTGKSYILQNLVKVVPFLSGNVTSTTGISAININGVTIHSWMGIGKIDFNYKKPYTQEERAKEITQKAQWLAKKISKKNKLKYGEILSCRILAIDEISMLSDDLFNLFDKVLKILRKNGEPFGGIQLILIGDFCQLPPVIKDNFDKNNQHFVFNSKLWKDLNLSTINLKTIHRQEKDKQFANILNDLRYGKNIEKAKNYLKSCEVDSNKLDFLLHIYPTNKQVDNRNIKFLNKIKSEEFLFYSEDYIAQIEYTENGRVLKKIRTATAEDIQHIDGSDKVSDKIESDTRAKQHLKLKIGCRAMLIKNINLNKGFANGSMGTIKEIFEDSIVIDIDKKGECIVKLEDFETDYNIDENQVLIRKQFPLTLAYAITIHKSQGLTFDEAVIEISNKNRINCGQGYVALSRVKTKEGLFIIGKFPEHSIYANSEVVTFYENI